LDDKVFELEILAHNDARSIRTNPRWIGGESRKSPQAGDEQSRFAEQQSVKGSYAQSHCFARRLISKNSGLNEARQKNGVGCHALVTNHLCEFFMRLRAAAVRWQNEHSNVASSAIFANQTLRSVDELIVGAY
jgi:hypothetical protein